MTHRHPLPLRPLGLFAALLSLILVSSTPARADSGRVVVSVPPLHSLVATLLDGVAQPALLMPDRLASGLADLSGGQIERLRAAELIVWSGPGLEGGVGEALRVMPGLRSRGLALSKTVPVLTPSAAGAVDRAGDGRDLRFWLDPRLVRVAVRQLVPALVRVYPDAAPAILDNEATLRQDLQDLERHARRDLGATNGVPLHVGRSELRYLEWRFNMAEAGCADAAFDPLAFGAAPGPDLYAGLMARAVTALRPCTRRDVAALAE